MVAAVESMAPAIPAVQYSNSMSQAAISPISQQPAPAYSSMSQPQPQVASSLNSLDSPTPQINPANTHHLVSDQGNPYGDEQVSYDQFNEARGDQT